METCSILHQKGAGWPRTSTEYIECVRAAYVLSPLKTVFTAARQLQSPRSTALQPDDAPKFSGDILQCTDEDDNFLKRATFHVTDVLNQHNVKVWGSEHPHESHEIVRNTPKPYVHACTTSYVTRRGELIHGSAPRGTLHRLKVGRVAAVPHTGATTVAAVLVYIKVAYVQALATYHTTAVRLRVTQLVVHAVSLFNPVKPLALRDLYFCCYDLVAGLCRWMHVLAWLLPEGLSKGHTFGFQDIPPPSENKLENYNRRTTSRIPRKIQGEPGAGVFSGILLVYHLDESGSFPSASPTDLRMWESMSTVGGFSRGYLFPRVAFRVAPYSPRFTYFGSRDLDTCFPHASIGALIDQGSGCRSARWRCVVDSADPRGVPDQTRSINSLGYYAVIAVINNVTEGRTPTRCTHARSRSRQYVKQRRSRWNQSHHC
ncbi:hypothetical protein PR048_004030 [Dryococelus australis]|uniref:Uncharacterized protein n=1 Tax=Dryococelus australis TaxID=614101 RepID=A0ABQ9I4T1_9NEOP|nr:hypothetical protein PR048_004030 [Dryococelus australis]